MKKSYRFWVKINSGDAKVTLTDDRPVLHWGQFKHHDEGYEIRRIRFTLTDTGVFLDCVNEGRDFDGRYFISAKFYCTKDDLNYIVLDDGMTISNFDRVTESDEIYS